MNAYVLGFLFNETRDKVLLIHKLRPEWQKGMLNGVGGHIEDEETPYDAMGREFKEETGVYIPNWEHCITLISSKANWLVMIYRNYGAGNVTIKRCQSITDEKISIENINNLPEKCIPNLRWIIPILNDNLKFPLTIVDEGYGE